MRIMFIANPMKRMDAFCYVTPINFYSFPLSKNNFFFKNEKKIRFFEKFHDFSENGRSCNEMALKYQRHVKD